MHRLATASLLPLVLTTLACAPTAKHSQPSPAPTATTVEPTAAAMGKRAPPQPGEQVSPVIAFRGGGEQWRVQIENAGGYAHTVEITWGKPQQGATGALRYQGPGDAAAILLQGSVATQDGPRAMQVDITPEACTDAAAQRYIHTVRVTIAGKAPMLGCGDLAK